jgi:hypothetical protein
MFCSEESVGSAMSVIGSSEVCGRFRADQYWYVYIWMTGICMINSSFSSIQ